MNLATVKILLLLWMMFSACSEEVKNTEQDRLQLLETDIEFSETSSVRGAAEAFKLYLTEDALQLPNNAEPIFGRDKIYQNMLAGPKVTLTWQPQRAEVSASGDMGYTWGNYQTKWKDEDGQAQTGQGKYLNVWKRQADGTWKVVVDMGNQNPPESSNPRTLKSTKITEKNN